MSAVFRDDAFLDVNNQEDAHTAVIAVRATMVTGLYDHPPHKHQKAQLILATRGFVTCSVSQGLWMVAPQCALWIPSGMEHGVRTVGDLELYMLFVDPQVVDHLPKECCTVTVSPLIRELLIEAATQPPLVTLEGSAGRLVLTLLDQLTVAPVEKLHLPMPQDRRLRKIADSLVHKPANRATIRDWAGLVGTSERTLCRLIENETGMTFGRWRQQFQIMYALKRMAEGESVKSIAIELGYETTSAFITMFKKSLGQPPGRYYAARREQRISANAAAVADE